MFIQYGLMAGPGFDVDEFIGECRTAVADSPSSLRDPLERAGCAGTAAIEALDAVQLGAGIVHVAPDLTVMLIKWPPRMYDPPHDHRMGAAIAMLAGHEDHRLYKRRDDGSLEVAADRVLADGEMLLLGPDAIHAVRNPDRSWSAALHVYAGDLFGVPRTEWDADGLSAEPLRLDLLLGRYEAAVAQSPPSPW